MRIEVEAPPIPAPRSRITNGVDSKPTGEVRPTLSKPTVAVKVLKIYIFYIFIKFVLSS